MKKAALGLLLLAFASVTTACAPGSGALLYCLAVDHDVNRRCH